MSRSFLPGALLIGAALFLLHHFSQPVPQPPRPAPAAKPAPKPKPKKPDCPCPNCPNCPNRPKGPFGATAERKPVLGGLSSPDDSVGVIPVISEIDWPRNIPSKGLGCCGFRSLDYCARVQHVPQLVDLPEQMRDDGVPGGAYPEKMDKILARYAKGASYWQDTSGSLDLVCASIASGRPVCIDYNGHDPHYSGGIAHCVTLIAADRDADWFGVLDNNFPSEKEVVWMGAAELRKRWGGWSYGLFAATPGDAPALIGRASKEAGVAVNPKCWYGLEKAQYPLPRQATVDGQPATIQDILDKLGPAMVPALKPVIEVDHTVDLEALAPYGTLALLGDFGFWLLDERKKGGQ